MRRPLVLFLALAPLLLAPASPTPAEADTPPAEWLARMNAALRPGTSMRADAVLSTGDSSGEAIDVRMELYRSSGADGDRLFVRVTAPDRASGTRYEFVERKDGSVARSAWLPTLERWVDETGIRSTDSFLGTEFTYEDLGLAAPRERGQGTATRVEDKGRDLVRLTSPPYLYYGRVVTFLDPQTALPVRVEFYDLTGALVKRETFHGVDDFDGIPFPTRIEMHNLQTDVTSRLELGEVRFDVEIPTEILESGRPTGP